MIDQRTLTKAEIEAIAELAARKALRHTFSQLGVNTEDQESVNRLRADLIFARDLRKISDSTKAKIWFIVLTAAVVGLMTAAWRGLWMAVPK